jgi:transposase
LFPVMKRISEQVRQDIISLLDTGLTSRKIAEQVGVSHTMVNIVRRTTKPGIPKPRAGRAAKLSVGDKRWLVRMITSGKVDTATKLVQELRNTKGMEINAETVRRALKETGLKAAHKQKKPRLLPKHRRQRMDFAILHKDWTVEDWKRVIWSDETKINRLGSDGQEWVWKQPAEVVADRHIQSTMKFGGGSLMVWGCMTAQGVGYMCRIDGRMNAELYTDILEDELRQTIDYCEMGGSKFYFQQDNDPKHTSNAARKWFSDNKIEVLEWPPQSPDLNPIEHLWVHLKRRLAGYETEPRGMIELWERVEAEWDKIPQEVCMGLIESMPRRVSAVLKAKGGHTKY